MRERERSKVVVASSPLPKKTKKFVTKPR